MSVKENMIKSIIILICIIIPASKATTIRLNFKDSVMVSDSVFTVGEIATVSGEDGRIVNTIRYCNVGMSAPPGYSRFISQDKVVRHTLANTFKSCRFICNGSKRILVKTAYKEYTIKMFSKMIHSYICENIKWEKKCWTVVIQNEDESFKCGNSSLKIHFEGLNDGYPKGNTVLKMVIAQGNEEYKIPVYCSFSIKIPVVVAVKDVVRQEPLSESNCTIRMMDITKFGPVPFQDISQLKEKRASRTIKAGTVLHERLVREIPVIGKDDEVSITVKRGRIRLSVPGIARESGGVGDRIWVKNKKSNKLVRVQIEKKGYVTIAKGGSSL